jgi:hypothetical protein
MSDPAPAMSVPDLPFPLLIHYFFPDPLLCRSIHPSKPSIMSCQSGVSISEVVLPSRMFDSFVVVLLSANDTPGMSHPVCLVQLPWGYTTGIVCPTPLGIYHRVCLCSSPEDSVTHGIYPTSLWVCPVLSFPGTITSGLSCPVLSGHCHIRFVLVVLLRALPHPVCPFLFKILRQSCRCPSVAMWSWFRISIRRHCSCPCFSSVVISIASSGS